MGLKLEYEGGLKSSKAHRLTEPTSPNALRMHTHTHIRVWHGTARTHARTHTHTHTHTHTIEVHTDLKGLVY